MAVQPRADACRGRGFEDERYPGGAGKILVVVGPVLTVGATVWPVDHECAHDVPFRRPTVGHHRIAMTPYGEEFPSAPTNPNDPPPTCSPAPADNACSSDLNASAISLSAHADTLGLPAPRATSPGEGPTAS